MSFSALCEAASLVIKRSLLSSDLSEALLPYQEASESKSVRRPTKFLAIRDLSDSVAEETAFVNLIYNC